MPGKKVFIIGAGIAGIATAVRLAARGFEVEVFEANSHAGGKLAEIYQDGFRFDAGPSLLTMPQYVDELFELAGKDAAQFFRYKRLDTLCQYFYENGSKFTAYADREKFISQVESQTAEGRAFGEYLDRSARIYRLTAPIFLEQSLGRLKTFCSRLAVGTLLRFSQIDPFRTMHQANSKTFSDARLVQYADRYATYNGSNPYQAPATFNVIAHLEQHFGAYFPLGGMYRIVTCLVGLAESLGVKFHYNSRVDQIQLSGKRAVGIIVSDTVKKADIVVSNIDVWFSYHKLLAAHPDLFPEKILRQQRSSSALIFYWGVKRQFSELELHNIFFSADYKAEFNHIWQQQNIFQDPTVYVNISAKLKADDAPAGCENWFVMINVPANMGQTWDQLISQARNHILEKLSRVLKTDIAALIISESVADPRTIERESASYQGSVYGASSNSRFAAFLRHANRSSSVKNLYFCGGSVHPGGGIPLCLLSAKITSEWIA